MTDADVTMAIVREVQARRLTPRQASALSLIWRSFRRTSPKGLARC